MIITATTSLVIIVAIAFVVCTYCSTKLIPIIGKIIMAKKANVPEVLIAGQIWKVNYGLFALTTLPLVAFVVLVAIYIWAIYRIVG